MVDPAKSAPLRLRKWRNHAQFTLYRDAGWEASGARQITQGFNGVELPPALLRKLQASVYNRVVEFAQADGPIFVTLYLSAQGGRAEPTVGDQTVADTLGEPGWGYFLIDRSLPDATEHGGAHYALELYCYQEGHEPS